MSSESSSESDYLEEKEATLLDYIYGNRINIFLLLMGLILLGSGIFIIRNQQNHNDIMVIEEVGEDSENRELFVEIAGAVEKPGVYKLSNASRVEDLLILSGGLSMGADRDWVERYLNRAALLSDGQKFYIPKEGEQTRETSANTLGGGSGVVWGTSDTQNRIVNINTASLKELDGLPGIGPVYAQSIIDHRPYSTVEDLVNKGALKQNVYEKVRELVSVH